jgi:hypothetical protein
VRGAGGGEGEERGRRGREEGEKRGRRVRRKVRRRVGSGESGRVGDGAAAGGR